MSCEYCDSGLETELCNCLLIEKLDLEYQDTLMAEAEDANDNN